MIPLLELTSPPKTNPGKMLDFGLIGRGFCMGRKNPYTVADRRSTATFYLIAPSGIVLQL
jgi:hypothetical protein